MKYAIVDGKRREAEPKLVGECPGCSAPMVAKCGEIKVWHWAHRIKRECDHWWEPETEWHRNWKNQFPEGWQEYVDRSEDGEKHIADVRTDQGWVIEFQHSRISPEERRSRESFYGNMVWVVDGLRRKRDLTKFVEAVNSRQPLSHKPLIVTASPMDCRLVQEWSSSPAPVFFDFGGTTQPSGLWFLIPVGSERTAYFASVGKAAFVSSHRKGAFNPQPIINEIKGYERRRERTQRAYYTSQLPRPWSARRSRRRF